MAFSEKDDKILKEFEVHDFDETLLRVKVFSYKNGNPKVQIERKIVSRGEEKFAKLGRLVEDELEAILPDLKEALEFMKKQKKTKKGMQKKKEQEGADTDD